MTVNSGALVQQTSTVSVHPKFVPIGEEPKYEPITGLGFLTMMLQASKNAGKASL
jgi:hypothetical protein